MQEQQYCLGLGLSFYIMMEYSGFMLPHLFHIYMYIHIFIKEQKKENMYIFLLILMFLYNMHSNSVSVINYRYNGTLPELIVGA